MEFLLKNKREEETILKNDLDFKVPVLDESTNKIFKGDNIVILKALLYQYNMRGKIDLIYIDPPFSTNNVFTTNENRSNTISMSGDGELAYSDTLVGDDFLEFIRERLILARELLSDEGSIYLHIDYKIGHYIKIIMDEIFGAENFKNDITRVKCNPKNFYRKAYGNIKDLILFYTKSKNSIWNECYVPYTEKDISNLYKKSKDGRPYTTIPLHAPGETKDGETAKPFKGITPPAGRHWRCSIAELEELDSNGLIEWSSTGIPRRIIFADEKKGKRAQDIWEFKDPQYPTYPTEKNSALLERIIETSSNKDSIVLDFFCGSGTTILAADKLFRNWIAIDNSEQAIKATIQKLEKNKNLYSKPFQVVQF